MPAKLAQQAIDLGIVIRDSNDALRFYRDTLGLEHIGDAPLPEIGSPGVMHRLTCGGTLIKLVRLDERPVTANPPGGLAAATGYRYFTIRVTNLQELVGEVEAAGYKVPLRPMDIRPGVTIAMVEDSDGNWVEFVQAA